MIIIIQSKKAEELMRENCGVITTLFSCGRKIANFGLEFSVLE